MQETKEKGFDPWVGKIPWRRAWQPTPVFLPGKCHGQSSLAGQVHGVSKESDMTEATEHVCMCKLTCTKVNKDTLWLESILHTKSGLCPLPYSAPDILSVNTQGTGDLAPGDEAVREQKWPSSFSCELTYETNRFRYGEQTGGCQVGERGMEWEVGVSRCKLSYIGWITRPYCVAQKTIQYPMINSNGKKYLKKIFHGAEINNIVNQLLMCARLLQLCPTLCNPMDCSLPDSSVHGVLQARILEWVAISSSRGSSQPRNWNHVSYIWVGRQVLYH